MKIRNDLENSSLKYYISECKKQNIEYFELKARDLLDREKSDMISQASISLLFKQLNMTKEDILKKYPNYVSQQKSSEPQTSVSANQKFKPPGVNETAIPEAIPLIVSEKEIPIAPQTSS